MGRKLNIAFLWHMHQPCYKDLCTNQFRLPWVRLHGIKGYYDMGKIVEEVEGARVTFNFVPSLLEQLSDYADGNGTDLYLEHTLKEAYNLTREEKLFILTNFFHAHPEHMIRPYPRYAELEALRGDPYRVSDRIDAWSKQDYLDLQVWFNLTWFGQTIKDKDEEIQSFIRKGQGFSEADKQRLIEKQREVIGKVIPLYRRLLESGQVELTTSPFYHPILPLLCDTDENHNSRPGSAKPKLRFAYPADADNQIRGGLAYHESVFGRRPRGMWPSEGSVSNAALDLIARNGLVWTASDENILANTLRGLGRPISGREFLYQPYLWESEGGQLAVFFRDHLISDLIGFVYHRWFTPDAVGDFINRLVNLKRGLPQDRSNLICIILDGENAWEYYYRQGYDFLTGIYRGLAEHPELELVTFSEYLWRFPINERTTRIYPGSWINADFSTWIGQPVKNLAWDYLTQTRQDLEAYSPEQSSEEQLELAWHEMMIAEGSDWFWWFGDTHSSALDQEFDELYRIHLKNVYRALDREPPDYLNHSVASAVEQGQPHFTEPVEPIRPVIDGCVIRPDGWNPEEWKQAGAYSFNQGSGAMQRSNYLVERICYGFDQNYLYLRLEGDGCTWLQGSDPGLRTTYGEEPRIEFRIVGEEPVVVRATPENGEVLYGIRVDLVSEQDQRDILENLSPYALTGLLEVAVPKEKLGFQTGDEFEMQIVVHNEKGELERWPSHEPLRITVPQFEQ
jgi:alpha-amylase/alpha-mannosidase (GH57 family)